MKIRKIEFWVITAVILFLILQLFQETESVLSHYDRYDKSIDIARLYQEKGLYFNYLQHHTYPLLAYYLIPYFSFLFINYFIYPKLYLQKKYTATVLLSVLVYVAVVIALTVANSWKNAYLQVNYNYFLVKNLMRVVFLFGTYVLYIILKENALRLYRSSENPYIKAHSYQIKREFLFIISIWLGVLLLFIFALDPKMSLESTRMWFTMAPYAYVLYALNRYWLLPEYDKSKRLLSYILKLLFFSFLLFIPFMLVFMVLIKKLEAITAFFVFWQLQMLIVVPFSWLVYYANRKKENQLVSLKTELGQTSANLDFLRSQINPHFLFNALNTLYGTALQENSERTAQGIQMLGDMMRFMLHENHLHKILLSREIEYMRNYIKLQSLRTSVSQEIRIQTKIEDVPEEKFIAPMLLIPFLENAFKHGISLKQKSWIKVTLRCEHDKLYFDVYNSTHPRQEQDPEKDKSGVGLENVKQRLALLYPGKHELVIRETSEEYFVHLTLEL